MLSSRKFQPVGPSVKLNSALTVMQISQKPINCSTPEDSPEKGASTRSHMNSGETSYEDLESAFLANIGNWKKLRRQDNKDIYKCNECESKLEVEKKGALFRVRVRNPTIDEAHNWFDQAHLEPFAHFNDDQVEDGPVIADRLHASIEAFVKLQLKQNEEELASPEDLFETMRRERPKLHQFFRPSLQQLAFFLISNSRKGDFSTQGALLSKLIIDATKKQAEENIPTTKKRDLKRKAKAESHTSNLKQPG